MQERDTGTILGSVKSASQTVYRLIFLDILAARTLQRPLVHCHTLRRPDVAISASHLQPAPFDGRDAVRYAASL